MSKWITVFKIKIQQTQNGNNNFNKESFFTGLCPLNDSLFQYSLLNGGLSMEVLLRNETIREYDVLASKNKVEDEADSKEENDK